MNDLPSAPNGKQVVDYVLHALFAVDQAHHELDALKEQLAHDAPGAIAGAARPEHADEYERTAALLRKRAESRPDDERRELEQRAAWFEGRAVIKRRGGIMPRELRTPLESLQLVDHLRRALVDAANVVSEIEPDEVVQFARVLVPAAVEPRAEPTLARAFDDLVETVRTLLAALGVELDDGGVPVFRAYAMPDPAPSTIVIATGT